MPVRIADGSLDFSGGVDSGRVTTVQSAANPNGLPRTQLAWLTNGTVRGGGIRQRTGWQPLILALAAGALFQGGWLYEPNFANPYLILSIGGRIYSALVEAPYTVTDLSAAFGLANPPLAPLAHFTQAEQFLIIQAGDLATFPATIDHPFQTLTGWAQPAVGAAVTVTLTAPYGGQLGDVGQVFRVLGGGDIFLANYTVSGIAGNTVTWTNTGGGLAPGLPVPGGLLDFYRFTAQGRPTLPLFWDGTTLRRSNGISLQPYGVQAITYPLTPTAGYLLPVTGASVVVTLTAPYTGSLNDTGDWTLPGAPGFSYARVSITTILANTITVSVISNPSGAPWAFGTQPIAFITTKDYGPNPSELPAAGPMVYYHGQVWYALGRQVAAGDYVGDQASGTLAYNFKDSVLKVTENPLVIGGDGFAVPDNAGDITALDFTANLNSVLGQGVLYVFTRKQVYALNVPITRDDWIAASSANQPLMTVAQRRYGAVGDRCVVPVNGDLFYQSMEPAVRSLKTSIRNDAQWLNPPVSRNENRVLAFNDRALMAFATGINFDNRLWQGILPVTTPVGVAFQGVMPLDFDVLGSLDSELPPAWEGMYEGLDILQLFQGDFGGRERAFSVIHNRDTGNLDVWELTNFSKTDNGDNRVPWFFETPAYTFGGEFKQKQLDGGEVWLDKIAGTIEMKVEYRVDADPCWQLWHNTEFCAARSSCEDVANPVCYPVGPAFCEGYKFPVPLPTPPPNTCQSLNHRPTNKGYQFQLRVTFKGWCRVRGLLLFALPLERAPFEGLNA